MLKKATTFFIIGVLSLPLSAFGVLFYAVIPLSMIFLVLAVREYYFVLDERNARIVEFEREQLKLKVHLATQDAIVKGLK